MQLLAFAALQFFAALAAALPQGGEWSRENNDDCWNPTVFSVVSTTVTSTHTTTTTSFARGKTITAPTSTVTEFVTATAQPTCWTGTGPLGANKKRDEPTNLKRRDDSSCTSSTATIYRTRGNRITTTSTSTVILGAGGTTTPLTTTTTTTTASPNQTITQDLSCPTVPATIPNNPTAFNYTRYYYGCGHTESFSNPGNTNPPVTTLLDGSLRSCDAIAKCADVARGQGAGYLSFDVHYRVSSGKWECVQFFGPNDEASYFSVEDGDVRDSYGYAYYSG